MTQSRTEPVLGSPAVYLSQYDRYKTLQPALAIRPRRSQACPTPWSTLEVLAGMRVLGYLVEDLGPLRPTSASKGHWLRFVRPEWRTQAPDFGFTPGVLVWQSNRYGKAQTRAFMTLQMIGLPEWLVVGTSSFATMALIQGAPLAAPLAQLDQAIQTPLRSLVLARPSWKVELVAQGERTYLRGELEKLRPLPVFKWPTPHFWNKDATRFDNIFTFRDRPSPYAIPEPVEPPPVSLGLPGNWLPSPTRWNIYLQLVYEYVFGTMDRPTQQHRTALRGMHSQIEMMQSIWEWVLGDPALVTVKRPTPPMTAILATIDSLKRAA